ncbi:hypothetical protein HZH68_011744 [Vespula germanica]|uniref:Uncharacterized protein n=1 Tax=Vespula germanica TaxID=30212 RepID=A0A834JKW1_VESGE|nr:hypothetical protein HZH68_011744 [Vespula germanica]
MREPKHRPTFIGRLNAAEVAAFRKEKGVSRQKEKSVGSGTRRWWKKVGGGGEGGGQRGVRGSGGGDGGGGGGSGGSGVVVGAL